VRLLWRKKTGEVHPISQQDVLAGLWSAGYFYVERLLSGISKDRSGSNLEGHSWAAIGRYRPVAVIGGILV